MRENEQNAWEYVEDLQSYGDHELFEITFTSDEKYLPQQEFPDFILHSLDPYGTGSNPPGRANDLRKEFGEAGAEGTHHIRFVGSMKSGTGHYETVGVITLTKPADGDEGKLIETPWTYQRVAFVAYKSPRTIRALTNQHLFHMLANEGKISEARHPSDPLPERRRYQSQSTGPTYQHFLQWGMNAWDANHDPANIDYGNTVARDFHNTRVTAAVQPEPEFRRWYDRPYRRPAFERDLDWMVDDDYIEDEIQAKDTGYWDMVKAIKEKFSINVNLIFPGETPTCPEEKFDIEEMLAGPVIWAYEGVVVPGGNFIVGRYWELYGDEHEYEPNVGDHLHCPELHWRENCGPFIFWLTDLGYVLKD
jgi:hypothetical protein